MDKVGDAQFHVMCQMWGVDRAIDAAMSVGMKATAEQIAAEREKEAEQIRAWNRIFKPKEG